MMFALVALLLPVGLGLWLGPSEFDLDDERKISGFAAKLVTAVFFAVPVWVGFALGHAA